MNFKKLLVAAVVASTFAVSVNAAEITIDGQSFSANEASLANFKVAQQDFAAAKEAVSQTRAEKASAVRPAQAGSWHAKVTDTIIPVTGTAPTPTVHTDNDATLEINGARTEADLYFERPENGQDSHFKVPGKIENPGEDFADIVNDTDRQVTEDGADIGVADEYRGIFGNANNFNGNYEFTHAHGGSVHKHKGTFINGVNNP